MNILNWLRRKRDRGERSRSLHPEIIEPFGPDSPFIGYMRNGTLVMTDRDTFDYQHGNSQGSDPTQREISALVSRATRVRALAGGIYRGDALKSPVLLDTSSADALGAFRSCFVIDEDPGTYSHCGCLGGPTLELLCGEECIATIGIQHGNAIRWKQWKHDALLRNGQLLSSWLTTNGVFPALLDVLYQNPFPFTGGRTDSAGHAPLAVLEQRLFMVDIRREQGRLEDAVGECDRLLTEQPDCVMAYVVRGHLRSDRGEFEASVADFSVALERGDSRADVFFGRAVALDHLGRHEDAIADCSKAIAIDPSHVNSYNSRGFVRMKIGDTEGALADFEAASRLAPQWALPFANRAQLAHSRGDLENAIRHYDLAIERIEARQNPKEVALLSAIFWNRGKAHGARGDADRADADFKEAIRREPKLAERST